MVDLNNARPRMGPEQVRRLLGVLAALCLLLAGWFAWSAWELHRTETRRENVQAARDAAVDAARTALIADKRRLAERVMQSAVRDAVERGEFEAAGRLLTQDWPGAMDGTVMPPDLQPAYAPLAGGEPPRGAYGRLGVLEAALVEDGPVSSVIHSGAEARLALATPVRVGAGDLLGGVALVELPLARVSGGLDAAAVPAGAYLALRQGTASVVEVGDTALSNGAEALARRINGSDLRVAAAVPDSASGPLGLGALGSGIVALVLLLLAALLGLGPHLLARRRGETPGDGGTEHTLAEVLQRAAAQAPAATRTMPAGAAPATPVDRPATPDAVVSDIDRGIFRAYDIRGIVGQNLDADVAERIGEAIGTLMHERGLREVVVGRDGRLSGPALTEGLIRGLRNAGRDVIDIGLAPTPLVYFGAYQLNAGSCVSVTGSHNPPDYNGFKVVIGGETLSGDAIVELFNRIAGDRLHRADAQGALREQDIGEDYVQRIAADVQIERPLRVVVDAGNGVAGDIAPRVLQAIGADVIPLYCDIDGTFPNHHPDPSEPHNLEDLVATVRREGADLGVAFDGDADRLGVVTREGTMVFADRLLMLFAADVLERNPGALVIFDVKCTGRLPGHILRHGGSPLMWKTGHSLIKAKMRETDAELAGEMSGHFFFKERWYGFDDGIYAAARLLEILAAQPGSPSDTLNALPDGISTPEIKVDAPGGNPHAFVERFRGEASFEGARLSTIDGLRVDWPDGWGLVRASNTTPVLVMRFDADSEAALARIQGVFREQLLKLKPDLALPF
jgi:phosphomannomutase/phosphoglucomutase